MMVLKCGRRHTGDDEDDVVEAVAIESPAGRLFDDRYPSVLDDNRS